MPVCQKKTIEEAFLGVIISGSKHYINERLFNLPIHDIFLKHELKNNTRMYTYEGKTRYFLTLYIST